METMPPLNVGRPSAISRIKLAYLARSLSRKFSIVLYRRLSVLATETKSHYLRDCGRVAHSSPHRALWLCGPTRTPSQGMWWDFRPSAVSPIHLKRETDQQ